MKYLSKKIKTTLSKINSEYPMINHGGCGSFARVLGAYLTELGYTIEFVPIYSSEDGLDEGNACVNNSEHKAWTYTSWSHIMVRVNGKLVDSQGVFSKLTDRYYIGLFSKKKYVGEPMGIEMLNEILSDKLRNRWNHTFNRNNMGVIGRKLRKGLELSK